MFPRIEMVVVVLGAHEGEPVGFLEQPIVFEAQREFVVGGSGVVAGEVVAGVDFRAPRIRFAQAAI